MLFSEGHSGTPSLFVQAAFGWYDLWSANFVRFVGGGSRQDPPLGKHTIVDRPDPLARQEFEQLLHRAADQFREHPSSPKRALEGFIHVLLDALVWKRAWAFDLLQKAGEDLYSDDGVPVECHPLAIFADRLRRVGIASENGQIGAINLWVFCRSGWKHARP